MTEPTDIRTARRRFLLVGVLAPVLLTVVAVTLMLAWLPAMPPSIATHWGVGGQPDGFGPAWLPPLLTAVIGLGLPALAAAIVLPPAREGEWGPVMRSLGALSLGTVAFLAVLATWTFGMQRGLDDPQAAPDVLVPIIASFAAGAVAGTLGWLAQPRVAVSGGTRGSVRQASALALAPGERAVWVRTTSMGRGGMIAIVAGILVLAGTTVVVALTGSGVWGITAAVTALLIVLSVTTFVLRVRVDETGLTVRSPLGVPRFHVPLGEVAAVEATVVNPLAQFGGWGIRSGLDGRFGVVLHSGEALQVRRVDGRVFVVTVDDADTAAALLEALAARTRA